MQTDPPPKKPASLTVFGILNIVFGAMGVICTCGSMAILFMPEEMTRGNPVYEIMAEGEGYQSFVLVSGVLGILAAGVLVIAGIGLLKASNWARVTSIGYGVFEIVYNIAGIVGNWVFLIQPLLDRIDSDDPAFAGAVGGAIGGMFGTLIGMIYPVVLIIFMMRRNVVEATRGPAAAAEPREAW